jgi:hypothetical protein
MRVTLFVAAAALVLCPGAPAATRTAAPTTGPATGHVVLRDDVGDTWTWTDATSYSPAAQPAADIIVARVSHGPFALRIRMLFDDLQRTGVQWYYCDVHSEGVTSWFVVEAKDGDYDGKAYQQIEGEWVRVPGLAHRINYSSDVMTFRVPRRLLRNPPWVRVRLRYQLGLPDGTFFTDNPTTDQPEAEFTGRLPHPASEAGSSGR